MTANTARLHPVYVKAAQDRERTGRDPWVMTADTAKLIRATLAARWPGVTFWVRSQTYAGGSSIHVYYDGVETDDRGRPWLILTDYDGVPRPGAVPTAESDIDYNAGQWGRIPRPGMPARRDVEDALHPFAGRRFDGMIDLAYHVASWLNPDGTATLGANDGTAGSRGSDPGYIFSRTHPSALLVSFGASYVFVEDSPPYDVRSKRS